MASSNPLDALFEALADPSRRQFLSEIGQGGPSTATELAKAAGMSRQNAGKHLAVLVKAGLVERKRVGRRIVYSVAARGLFATVAWLGEIGCSMLRDE